MCKIYIVYYLLILFVKLSEEYTKKTGKKPLVVIDGMSCLRKLYGKLIWICGGQWLGYIEHIEHFVQKMIRHGINMVFFFDGNTPVSYHIKLECSFYIVNFFF